MVIDMFALKAVSLAASTEETRYYLNGVYVEAKDKKLTMVATNGHILMGISFETYADDTFGEIIPLSLINLIKINSKQKRDGYLHVEDKKITLTHGDFSYSAKAIDGIFPNWRVVLPKEATGEAAQFDPKYVSVFRKASEVMRLSSFPTIAHNGRNPTLIHWYPNAIGIIMPLANQKIPTLPEWVKLPEQEK